MLPFVLVLPRWLLSSTRIHNHATLELLSVKEHACWDGRACGGTIKVGNTGDSTPRAIKGMCRALGRLSGTRGIADDASNHSKDTVDLRRQACSPLFPIPAPLSPFQLDQGWETEPIHSSDILVVWPKRQRDRFLQSSSLGRTVPRRK